MYRSLVQGISPLDTEVFKSQDVIVVVVVVVVKIPKTKKKQNETYGFKCLMIIS